jgi:hypothetical protein
MASGPLIRALCEWVGFLSLVAQPLPSIQQTNRKGRPPPARPRNRASVIRKLATGGYRRSVGAEY